MADDRDARIAQLEEENAALRAELRSCHAELHVSNRERAEALEQQTAQSEVLRVIAATPTDLQACSTRWSRPRCGSPTPMLP
jgi:hypothetical protein